MYARFLTHFGIDDPFLYVSDSDLDLFLNTGDPASLDNAPNVSPNVTRDGKHLLGRIKYWTWMATSMVSQGYCYGHALLALVCMMTSGHPKDAHVIGGGCETDTVKQLVLYVLVHFIVFNQSFHALCWLRKLSRFKIPFFLPSSGFADGGRNTDGMDATSDPVPTTGTGCSIHNAIPLDDKATPSAKLLPSKDTSFADPLTSTTVSTETTLRNAPAAATLQATPTDKDTPLATPRSHTLTSSERTPIATPPLNISFSASGYTPLSSTLPTTPPTATPLTTPSVTPSSAVALLLYLSAHVGVQVLDTALDCGTGHNLRPDLWLLRVYDPALWNILTRAHCYGVSLIFMLFLYLPLLAYGAAALVVAYYLQNRAHVVRKFGQSLSTSYEPSRALSVIRTRLMWRRTETLLEIDAFVVRIMYVGSLAILLYAHAFRLPSHESATFVHWLRQTTQIAKIASVFVPPWFLISAAFLDLQEAYNDLRSEIERLAISCTTGYPVNRRGWDIVLAVFSNTLDRTSGYYSHWHGGQIDQNWIVTVSISSTAVLFWQMIDQLNEISKIDSGGLPNLPSSSCGKWVVLFGSVVVMVVVMIICLRRPRGEGFQYQVSFCQYLLAHRPRVCFTVYGVLLLCYSVTPLILFYVYCPTAEDCRCS